MNNWLEANWPAPDWLHAGCTSRSGGFSQGPYAGLNLASHVGDQPQTVQENRSQLQSQLDLPEEPYWLQQIHSAKIIEADPARLIPECDGAFTEENGTVVAVLTADCLPLLLCDTRNRRIAAVHVGWRGFARGIVQHAIELFAAAPDATLAWLGPCIGARHYEVDASVRDACLQQAPEQEQAFVASRTGHWWFDLTQMVTATLQAGGIEKVFDSGSCTFSEPDRWYSYRRDGVCGRMASLIWMQQQTKQE